MKVRSDDNYTAVGNHILKNKQASLKARGLFITMWSMADEWEFSISGLSAILKEGKASIRNTLNELEEQGYLVREQGRGEHGCFGNVEYVLCETPDVGKPVVRKPDIGKPDVGKLNTIKQQPNKTTTNKTTTNKTTTKKSLGEFGNVKLSEEEYKAVLKDYGNSIDEAISVLDDYIEQSGKKYKSHRAVLKKTGWVYEKIIKSKQPKNESKYVEPVYDGRKKQKKTELDDLPDWLGR